MLFHKHLGAGGVGGGVSFIGSNTYQWYGNVGQQPTIQVPSGSASGDLILLAYAEDSSGWNIFTTGLTGPTVTWTFTNTSGMGAGLGYFFYDGVNGSIDFSGSASDIKGASFVIASFSGLSTVGSGSTSNSTAGMPNGPSVTASDLTVVSGHLDDDAVTMTTPSGWDLAGATSVTDGADISSVALAYQIGATGTVDPAAFGGGGDDLWYARTQTFSI